jgi:hypothetical protein
MSRRVPLEIEEAREGQGRVWLPVSSLARIGPTIFGPFACLGQAAFLHQPVLKAAPGQALEERPGWQFFRGQRLHELLFMLTLPYTTLWKNRNAEVF